MRKGNHFNYLTWSLSLKPSHTKQSRLASLHCATTPATFCHTPPHTKQHDHPPHADNTTVSLDHHLFCLSRFGSDHNDNSTNNRNTTSSSRNSGKATHSSSSSTISKTKLHHALVVLNIKNQIHVVLEMEKDQYGTWVELFCIHVRSHRVLHLIIATKDKTSLIDTSNAEYKQWTTFDSIVLQGYIQFPLTC